MRIITAHAITKRRANFLVKIFFGLDVGHQDFRSARRPHRIKFNLMVSADCEPTAL